MAREIKIAGAGLSGLTAGINLARNGYGVVIFEKGPEVGLRFSNDFQGIVNWMADIDVPEFLKSMNIKPGFFISPLDCGIFFGPGFRKKKYFKTPKPVYYLVRRGSKDGCLDLSLKRQFLDEGGKIEFNARADLEKMDIVATGPAKATLKTLGYNFKTKLPDIVSEVVDNNIAPKAYAYLLIRGGEGTLGAVISKDFQNHDLYLQKAVDGFEKEFKLIMEDKKKFGGYAGFSLKKTAIINKRLYVGEAAGFQDNFTGYGMFFAIRSGYLAARSIMENLDYDKLWKKEFSGPIKATLANRFLFEMAGNRCLEMVPGLVAKYQDNLLEIMKKGYTFDRLRQVIYPIACCFRKTSRE